MHRRTAALISVCAMFWFSICVTALMRLPLLTLADHATFGETNKPNRQTTLKLDSVESGAPRSIASGHTHIFCRQNRAVACLILPPIALAYVIPHPAFAIRE